MRYQDENPLNFMEYTQPKTGFIAPKIDDTHFVLGGLSSLPQTVVNPSGDWTPYLPEFESQLEESLSQTSRDSLQRWPKMKI